MCFVKCKFDQSLFKKNGGGIKGTHFIGVRVGCLKINRNFDKKIFFQKMSILNLYRKSYQNSFHMLTSIFFVLFLKTLYLIKKYHILLTIFTENGRPYVVDFEWRVSRGQKLIFIALIHDDWCKKNNFFLWRKIIRSISRHFGLGLVESWVWVWVDPNPKPKFFCFFWTMSVHKGLMIGNFI